jgi:hypothetical protein
LFDPHVQSTKVNNSF